jgi:hypothetical protein
MSDIESCKSEFINENLSLVKFNDRIVNIGNNENDPISDEISLNDSNLAILGGAMENIFLMHILPYFNSFDLCNLSQTSKYFYRLSASPKLWNILYNIDFVIENFDDTPAPIENQITTKKLYIDRYKEYNQKIKICKQEKTQFLLETNRLERVRIIEIILDFTQVRLILPVLTISIFLSITLFCLKIDGLNISYWVCSIPVLFSLVYVIVSLKIVQLLHNKQFSTTSLLRGLWNNFRGPIKFFFQDIIGESTTMMYCTLCIVLLIILQIVLISIKISKLTSQSVKNDLSWGAVFSPIWVFFTLFCIVPFSRIRHDPAIFVIAFVLLWIPFFVLFVCLTLKFDGQNNHSKEKNLRLAFIFIPFWIIEGSFLLFAAIFLIYGIQRFVFKFLLLILYCYNYSLLLLLLLFHYRLLVL